MSVFVSQVKTFTRSAGDSSVGAAAYRLGLSLLDETTGVRHDFTRKGGVVAAETLLPAGAPKALRDPAALWNAAERAENRKNSRVARELLVALPHELGPDARLALARDVAGQLVTRYCVGVSMGVHAPSQGGDDRNHHAHLLFTTRRVDVGGLGAKTRELDDKTSGPLEVEAIRGLVETTVNRHLAMAGQSSRVDRRKLVDQAADAAAQGDFVRAAELDRKATIHVGSYGTQLARQGKPSTLAGHNAAIREDNAQRLQAVKDFAREAQAGAAARGAWMGIDEQAAHAVALAERHTGRTALITRERLAVEKAGAAAPIIGAMTQPSRAIQRTRLAGAGAASRVHVGGGSAPKLARVKGTGSEVLNAQAAMAEESIRQAIANARLYIKSLEDAAANISKSVDEWLRILTDLSNTAMLSAHFRNPAFVAAVANIEKEQQAHIYAAERPTRRREAAAAAAEIYENNVKANTIWLGSHPQPPSWKFLTKAHWEEEWAPRFADQVRTNRAHTKAAAKTTPAAMAGYAQRTEACATVVDQAIADLRQRWPLPTPVEPPPVAFPWGPPAADAEPRVASPTPVRRPPRPRW